ncbi:MAG TPA: hypothetical protein VM733_03215 [Thermoanaerobaculia bacterium]|nr:hypothetical protein [Thermoanaerobaculia bacterium]
MPARVSVPQFPGPYAISWTVTPDPEREELLIEAGIPQERRERAIAWATETFDEAFGWPGVFYTVDAALAARAQFYAHESPMKVIGLGLPEDLAEGFIIDATPPQSPPGYAPNGESGYLECVRQKRPLPPDGRVLGYEALNLFMGMLGDSWLCSGLEKELDLRAGAYGLIASLEDAARCCAAIDAGKVAAENGPWYPFVLIEY